jgi:hypothetical protein
MLKLENMNAYYTPEQERLLNKNILALTAVLSSEQRNSTFPLTTHMTSAECQVSKFHDQTLLKTLAGILMLAETLLVAGEKGWQLTPAKDSFEYQVFSTSARSYLEKEAELRRATFRRISSNRPLL